MKICVIGNSHAASLKMAWDNMSSKEEYKDFNLTFFASPRDSMLKLEYIDGKFFTQDDYLRDNISKSSSGAEEIIIKDYDHFIIHGLISINRCARTYLSSNKKLSTLDDITEGNFALELRKLIRKNNRSVTISPEPRFSAAILTSETTYGYEKFIDKENPENSLIDFFVSLWNEQVAKHAILDQPSETIVNEVFTHPKFQKNENDRLHANEVYGEIVLRNTLKNISSNINDSNAKSNPYIDLPDSSYWKLAVVDRSADTVNDFYSRRFSIQGKTIATAGSCFAQEIAKELRRNGFNVLDKEPITDDQREISDPSQYGYGLYSARHGNIYTTPQLLQLAKEATGLANYDQEAYIWEKAGRYYDAFRPNIEPNGFETKEEVESSRKLHVKKFREVLESADIFVFTLGLTETWRNKKHNVFYPTAPGVIAGEFDSDLYEFVNLDYHAVYSAFKEFINIARSLNKDIKFITTVSPVPLTATAERSHVLISTVRSKSILRAVTSQLYTEFDYLDYFPSYEIFSTPFLGDSLFQNNRRTVSREGVASVMRVFFKEHGASNSPVKQSDTDFDAHDDVVCEEALLEAFAPRNN